MSDTNPTPAIALVGLHKAFLVDDTVVPVLDGLDLTVAEGEFVALVGPSGCGKSTALNMITGLLTPDRGRVMLRGRSAREQLGQVGYMPQRDLLMPWRTILENVLLGPEVQGHDLERARAEAQELLPLFGLEGFAQSYPAQLSGGMRQRAALLRTMMLHPTVLALDEPLSAVDALTRRAMRDWLLQVWRRFRQTVVLVTHDIDEALYLADRVCVMSPRPGRVVLDAPTGLLRPRHPGMMALPRFLALRDTLLEALGL